MQVILLEDVKNTGRQGEVVDVKRGYARNYLFPRKLAELATESNLKVLEAKEAAYRRNEAENIAAAEEKKAAIEKPETVVLLHVRTGEEGRLFGSVTSSDIADGLKDQFGVEIDRRDIELKDNINSLGQYQVPVRLHRYVDATIAVNVAAEQV